MLVLKSLNGRVAPLEPSLVRMVTFGVSEENELRTFQTSDLNCVGLLALKKPFMLPETSMKNLTDEGNDRLKATSVVSVIK